MCTPAAQVQITQAAPTLITQAAPTLIDTPVSFTQAPAGLSRGVEFDVEFEDNKGIHLEKQLLKS